MVLTDLPFERSSLIHNRYSLLRRPDSAPVTIGEDIGKKKISKEYAAFLKEHERKAGLDGFVDSNKYSHSYLVKKDKDKERARSSSENRASVVLLKARVEKDKKDYDRRIKVIEDHMWQHKQEERELKRTEGDIVKNQRAVRQTLRDYENAITKKRMEEEKKLNTGLEKYTKLKREQTHKKEDILKQRTERGIIKLQQNKSLGRKVTLKSSDIARKYHTKLSDLELKRIEVMRLSQEFENKMRQKEEEQYRLKAELAELAIALNMESQKGRVFKYDADRESRKEKVTRINEDLTTDQSVESKLAKSEGDTKTAEMDKRKLSADMLLTRSHLSIKQRDEQRHLTDTQMRLADNSNVQRQLNEAAFHAEMDLKARQIDQKVEAHNTRRVSQLQTSMKQKKEKEEVQQRELEEKFRRRQAEELRKQHEDSLKFFKKMVSKGEDLEQMLYGKVRNCEYNRQKQEQNVRRIHQALSDLRKKNASMVKEEIAECFQLEKDLEQKLLKEKAELDKVHAQREESYFRLQKHRQILREDKHNLVEHEREHTRLIRIGSRSDSYLTD